jgi:hypothetical protein
MIKSVPITTPVWGIVGACIRCIEKGSVVSSVIKTTDEYQIEFVDKTAEIQKSRYLRLFPINIEHDKSSYEINGTANYISLTAKGVTPPVEPWVDLANTLSEYPLDPGRAITYESRNVIHSFFDDEKDHFVIEDSDNLLVKLKFFHENINNMLSFFSTITRTHSVSDKHEVKLSQLWKANRFMGLFDQIEKPSKESLHGLILLLKTFYASSVKNIKVMNYSLTKENPYIVVKFMGFTIVREQILDPFKYLNHPGINFMALHLEKSGKFVDYMIKANKEMIKVL